MFRIIKEAKGEDHGILAITGTIRTAALESHLTRLGLRPATHDEIEPADAEESPIALIAIGSKIQHPEHKHETPSYFGYDKKGQKVHVIATHGSLNPDIHIKVWAA